MLSTMTSILRYALLDNEDLDKPVQSHGLIRSLLLVNEVLECRRLKQLLSYMSYHTVPNQAYVLLAR